MAQNLTTGVVQVIDNSVESINAALAQVLEQLDHLRGLRGITAMFDQTTVSTPTQSNAAVRLDQLQALVSDPSDPFAAAQRMQAGTGLDPGGLSTDLDEALLAALTARGGPTATQVYYAEGVETMNIYAALQQLGMV